MKIILSVSRPFEFYKRGDLITDPAEIAAVKGGANRHNVVRLIERPEHASGTFFKSDAELKAE